MKGLTLSFSEEAPETLDEAGLEALEYKQIGGEENQTLQKKMQTSKKAKPSQPNRAERVTF